MDSVKRYVVMNHSGQISGIPVDNETIGKAVVQSQDRKFGAGTHLIMTREEYDNLKKGIGTPPLDMSASADAYFR